MWDFTSIQYRPWTDYSQTTWTTSWSATYDANYGLIEHVENDVDAGSTANLEDLI